jgi:hypothetical protein
MTPLPIAKGIFLLSNVTVNAFGTKAMKIMIALHSNNHRV